MELPSKGLRMKQGLLITIIAISSILSGGREETLRPPMETATSAQRIVNLQPRPARTRTEGDSIAPDRVKRVSSLLLGLTLALHPKASTTTHRSHHLRN